MSLLGAGVMVWLAACTSGGRVVIEPSSSTRPTAATDTDTGTRPTVPAGYAVDDRAVAAGLQDDAFGGFKRGRGCTVSDLDLDGDPDLVLVNPADTTYVMLNDGQGGFSAGPVLDEEGLPWAAAAADLDGDGDEDLFLAYGGLEGFGHDRLLRNDLVETGSLAFTDITDTAGVAGPLAIDPRFVDEGPLPVSSLGGTFVDFDGDADLDLYVDTTPWPEFWDDEIPEGTVVGRNLLWRNDGDDGTGVRFTEVAGASGLDHQASSRYSSWLDIDHDGDLDLFENNMRTRPNKLWRNDGGTFVDVTASWALDGGDLAYPLETFASTAVDANLDGWDDLVLFVRGFATEGPYLDGHVLLLNAEGRGFVDATVASNLNDPFVSGFRDHLSNGVMGATMRDISGEGIPDLFAGNGGPGAGWSNMFAVATELRAVSLGDEAGTLDVPIYDDWTPTIDWPAEEDPTSEGQYPPFPYRTHGACVADLSGDGHAELYVTNGGMSWVGGDAVKEPNRWFHVVPPVAPRWVRLALRGDGVRVPATPVGARVEVALVGGSGPRRVTDTLRTQTGFSAQHGTSLHLHLGDAEAIDQVTVWWPDGHVQRLDGLALDREHVVSR